MRIDPDAGTVTVIGVDGSNYRQDAPPALPSPPMPPAPSLAGGGPGTSAAPTAGFGVVLDASGALPISAAATGLQVFTADPASPKIGQMWFRSDTKNLCVRLDATTTVRVLLA